MLEETRATARVALAVLHHVEDQAGRDGSLFDLLKCMVDVFQVSFLIDHMGLAVSMKLEDPARSRRVPTIEPTILIPLSTVSKIGSCM